MCGRHSVPSLLSDWQGNIMGTYMGKRGNDLIKGSAKADFIYGREGDDNLSGGGGNDNIYGGIGSDTIYGEAGNDRLDGESGNDTIYGGEGDDNVLGGADNDFLYGGVGNDVLRGGSGNDLLFGEDGNDEFLGSADGGNDTFTGGAGNDIFFFSSSPGTITTIADFERNGDDALWMLPQADANAALAGNQQWEFVAGGAPTVAPANGNGQATVMVVDGNTILNLYNNDADFLTANVTVVFNGIYTAEQLQVTMYNYAANAWVDPGIIYPGG